MWNWGRYAPAVFSVNPPFRGRPRESPTPRAPSASRANTQEFFANWIWHRGGAFGILRPERRHFGRPASHQNRAHCRFIPVSLHRLTAEQSFPPPPQLPPDRLRSRKFCLRPAMPFTREQSSAVSRQHTTRAPPRVSEPPLNTCIHVPETSPVRRTHTPAHPHRPWPSHRPR